jgi:hypothetical protein
LNLIQIMPQNSYSSSIYSYFFCLTVTRPLFWSNALYSIVVSDYLGIHCGFAFYIFFSELFCSFCKGLLWLGGGWESSMFFFEKPLFCFSFDDFYFSIWSKISSYWIGSSWTLILTLPSLGLPSCVALLVLFIVKRVNL